MEPALGGGDAAAAAAAAAAGPPDAAGDQPLLASASSLNLHLPLSPVVAPPIAEGAANGPGSPTAGPASPRMLRASSSKQYCAAALRRPGVEVWAFGRGDYGQLGTGGTDDSAVPVVIEALRGRDVVSVAAGTVNTAAVTADGELYVCGSNDSCQLGIRQRDSADVLAPTRVTGLENYTVEQVVCGASHTLALLSDGTVAGCGDSEFGQTGLGTASAQVAVPRVIKDLRQLHVARLAAGGAHTLALSSTGGVFSFGSGVYGQLGRDTSKGSDVPRPISRLWPLGVIQVACGGNHSAALLVDGRLLTWGHGRHGQLGHGDMENRSTPAVVRALLGVRGQQVSCGDDHTALLAADGSLWTFGRNTWGQTGHAHSGSTCLPQRVAALEGRRVVQVAAGGRHTLALCSDNRLFAFGNNDSGQLSGAPCSSQPAPQLVQGLPQGCPVLFVAAGGDHSIAVVDRNSSVDSLQGLAAVGPCTLRAHGEQWCAVQLPDLLHLTADAAAHKGDRAKLEAVIAGIETVFASPAYLLASLRQPPQQQQQQQQQQDGPAPPGRAAGGPTGGGAAGAAADEAEPMDSSPRGAEQQAAGALFAAAIEREQPGAAAGACAPADHQQQQQQQQQQQGPDGDGGVDLPRIGAAFQALLRLYEPEVASALGNTCVRLLDMLEKFLNSLAQQQEYASSSAPAGGGRPARQDLSWVAPLLFVLLQSPLNGEPATFGSKLLMRISRVVSVTLPAQERLPVRQALQALLSRLPADVLAARCVRPVQRHIEACVHAGLGATRVQVLMAGVLLDILRQANEDAGGIVPYAEFHSRALSEHANLQAEYLTWRQNKDGSALCSICQMPYLLTPEAKSRIMHGEAAMEQQQHLSNAAMQALFQGVSPSALAFLHLNVRRTHVVEDALNQLVYRAEDLKKPLRVTFISGGVPEPAQDEGGVTKEFFMLLVRDLFKPEYSMFVFDPQTRTYWFNPASLESEIEFALVGAVLGLAIYNGVILDVHLPMVVYQKLLGVKPTFADFKAAFPELGRGLQQLLDFKGDVEGVFCRSFAVELEYWGEVREVELKPGGAHIPVTADNREEYVRLYVDWTLDRSVEKQFAAFRRGFLRVCSGPALSMFTPSELELLICGLPHLDFEALQRVAKYEGGYTRDSQVVRWFWELLHGFSLEQKRAFLQFTTGSDRAPIGGLGKLPLLIQRAGPDTDRLPTSHTCFNALLIPEYSSKDKLRHKLLTAINNAQGFGLQ